MDELGRLLFNVCAAVPKGVVCFLPSYDYEKALVAHWTTTGALCRLQSKKVLPYGACAFFLNVSFDAWGYERFFFVK
jgi:hypothetical protein